MKKIAALLFLSVGLQAAPQDISCNERIKHGPKGVYKGLLALASTVACGYFAWDVYDKKSDLFAPEHLDHKRAKRWELIRMLLAESLGAAALASITWKYARESKESLTIFLSNNETESTKKKP